MAKLRPPKEVLPKINSAGEGGWFDIQELNMTDKQITGKVSFNIISKPTVKIDRVSGEIAISGMTQDFEGDCEARDLDAKPRF